jgi:hypothetical protein
MSTITVTTVPVIVPVTEYQKEYTITISQVQLDIITKMLGAIGGINDKYRTPASELWGKLNGHRVDYDMFRECRLSVTPDMSDDWNRRNYR